jgi:hypothetical protein
MLVCTLLEPKRMEWPAKAIRLPPKMASFRMRVTHRTTLTVVSLVLNCWLAANPSFSQEIGILTCSTSITVGYLVGSSSSLTCTFTWGPNTKLVSTRESYDGHISRTGLDLGVSLACDMNWQVLTSQIPFPTTLAGRYSNILGVSLSGILGASYMPFSGANGVRLDPIGLNVCLGANVSFGAATVELAHR